MTTGPNTPEGKAAVAMNGLKHGLRSNAIVLPDVESEEEWDEFREGIMASLAPKGRLEEELALRVAQLQWRLRRGLRAEHDAVLAERLGGGGLESHPLIALMMEIGPQIDADFKPPDLSKAPDLPPASLPGHQELAKIMRYEAQYTRQLFQTLHALQAIQAQRNGKAIPLIRVQWH